MNTPQIRIALVLQLCTAAVLAFPILSRADVQTTYNLNLTPGTSAGNPVTNIMIFEVAPGSSQVAIDFGPGANGYTLPGTGAVQLTHTSAVAPAMSFIMGLTWQIDKLSLVMFVNNNFAAAAAGIRFNDVFQSMTHNALIAIVQAAEAGSAADRDWFRDVFYPIDGSRAAFATGGSNTAMEFTGGVIIGGVPETGSTALLLSSALATLLIICRSRSRHRLACLSSR